MVWKCGAAEVVNAAVLHAVRVAAHPANAPVTPLLWCGKQACA